MLKQPYSHYERLFFYILDLPSVPEITDPDFIGAWPEGETVMLFFHKEKQHYIEALCLSHNCSIVYQADLDYQDWENGAAISPFSVGNLTVAPVWDSSPAQIKLDPSVIFGNGFHPTTRLCLESLVALSVSVREPFRDVLDLGCGTGLLGIATAKLGAKSVLVVDNNDLACEVAKSNIDLNNLTDIVSVDKSDLSQVTPVTSGVDVVLANLHHTLLISLFENRSFWQAKYYIISGFFTHKEDILLAELPVEQLRFLHRQRRQKWGVWVLENTVA